jgi:hypothetical protein
MREAFVFLLVASMSCMAALQAEAAELPLVVAVDTSRSLSPGDLEAARSTVAETLLALPAAAPVGLIAFNDEATWVVPVGSTRGDLENALPSLGLEGSFTVLHDALFLAARELPEGGIILLLSDGRDERSATTVEDVERLCASNHVIIVATGLGPRINDRALRRLALLTNGSSVGRIESAGPAIVAAIEQARSEHATRLAEQTMAQPSQEQTTEPPSTAESEIGEPGAQLPGMPAWLLPAVAAALLLGMILIVILLLRQRRPPKRSCGRCGALLEEWEESCPVCEIRELEKSTGEQPLAKLAAADEGVLDPKVFDKEPLPAGLEQTLVLDEQPVVIVREPGKPPRSYTLPNDQVFAVGRAPEVNTLVVDDPTVSGQHFKLVPKEGEIYVVDLDTTNGTSVNRERIRVKKIKPGDLIHAGAIEIEYNVSITRQGAPSS